MSGENTRLNIHTQLNPEPQAPIRWKCVRKPRGKAALSFSDRLLRSSAIACALLLAILAVGSIDQPWAKTASKRVEQALTMHIDLDDSIGQLSFVKNLMPESALVFFNLNEHTELASPTDGTLRHPFAEDQPWLLFDCADPADVRAADDGTVTLVARLSDGSWGVMVDHGSGRESVYAYLSEVSVTSGAAVAREQIVGTASGTLYFEWREQEASVNPAPLMGIQA